MCIRFDRLTAPKEKNINSFVLPSLILPWLNILKLKNIVKQLYTESTVIILQRQTNYQLLNFVIWPPKDDVHYRDIGCVSRKALWAIFKSPAEARMSEIFVRTS